ncbi:MAG TPA: TonB-dependent receptor plug domain-containing protein, partial [Sphingobacteriaceae bacterium]
ELQEQVNTLKEVVVTAEKTANVNRTQMGLEKINIQTIKQVPTVFGEADILRVMLTLPGVKSVGEASTGFNVRGGATDQNLILFNDATIYNPSHFFGFFSAFNPEVVKDAELYKSSIPGRFGGRLASVLDVHSRDGNKKKLTGSAGIGLITTRLNVEAPLIKDKTSFILGGRTSYSNWLLKMLPDDSEFNGAKAGFYDVNLHLTHEINKKDNLYFTGYISGDNSNLGSDTTYSYYNSNASIKWKHIFNTRFYGVFSTGFDKYENKNHSDENPVNAYNLNFSINQTNLKAGFNYYLNPKNSLEFGLNSIYYGLNPGTLTPIGNQSLVQTNKVSAEQALESALYLSNRYEMSSKLSLDFGLRYSMFNYLGPKEVYTYPPNFPKEVDNIIDTVSYARNDLIKTYQGPEYRLSARYNISDDFSVKAAYNTMRQYIHLLSNTTSMAPTDIWKLSDLNIRPQFGSQISLGLYKNFKSNTIETSVEVYHKRIKDYLDYKSGAVLLLNHHLETDVVNTKGKAYGLEFMIKKPLGKLNGWLSYTYSRILLKMDDANAGQLINNGNYYPGNYDKPHDVTLIGNYKISHRFSTSFNVTYSTGRPITLPLAKFNMAGSERTIYSDRNAYRIPDYFRTDFSLNIDGNHKVHQLTHSSWTIGVYNLTGRN